MSPFISTFVYRPSMMGSMVHVHSLVMGSLPGPIHIVDLPVHSPASFVRSSCIFPGVAAAMQAFMSSMVQPGGSFISVELDLASSFDASAFASDATRAAAERVATSATIVLGRAMMSPFLDVRCSMLEVRRKMSELDNLL